MKKIVKVKNILSQIWINVKNYIDFILSLAIPIVLSVLYYLISQNKNTEIYGIIHDYLEISPKDLLIGSALVIFMYWVSKVSGANERFHKETLDFNKKNSFIRNLNTSFLRAIEIIRYERGVEAKTMENKKIPNENSNRVFKNIINSIWASINNSEYSYEEKTKIATDVLNFEGMDFIFLNLKKINLQYANLKYVDFHSANLQHSNLSYANLKNSNLSQAELKEADLKFSNLTGADLKSSNMQQAKVQNSNLQNAKLIGAYLKSASFQNANLSDADFTIANLNGANLTGASLNGAVFKGASLYRVNLSSVEIVKTSFQGADLNEAYIEAKWFDYIKEQYVKNFDKINWTEHSKKEWFRVNILNDTGSKWERISKIVFNK